MTVRSDSAPTTAPAIVRTAALADAASIAELSGQLGYPATPEQVAERLRRLEGNTEHVVYLAELREGPAAGKVIGWVHVHECRFVESEPCAEVSGLVIADGHRSRGAGRLLMQHAEQWARARALGAVLLRSNVVRAGAHAFYEKLGYQTIKTQKVFRKIF